MIPLTLTLTSAPAAGVDLAALTPHALAGKSAQQIARLRVPCGRRRLALASLFDIEGEDTTTLRIRRAAPSLHGIGRDMTSGSIEVWGDVGDELGRGMRGGRIRVRGRAGHYAGAGMRGGQIDVAGDAGDFAAAGWPGEPLGMRGGSLRIGGNAGARLADSMRRGLVVVEGGCGACCASRMVAGTVIVLGPSGPGLGLGMRRGTVVLAHDAPALPATFNDSGSVELGYLAVLLRYAAGVSRRLRTLSAEATVVRRWVGDMGALGKGEVLLVR